MSKPKFVINCSANFTSLRIEDPTRKSPGIEPHNNEQSHEEYMLQKMPEISRHFILEGKIGEGTFAKVYRARLIKNTEKIFALKYAIPTVRPIRIAEEIRFLRDLGGQDNVCGVESCILNNGHTVMVLPYFPHDRFQDYMHKMDIDEIRNYLKCLLKALARIHSFGIIHRDVKPSNFLYCYETKQCLLVDFGLAQNQKEFEIIKKRAYAISTGSNKTNMKENTTQPARNVIANSAQVVGKPENKQIVLKKRAIIENVDKKSKKLKNVEGNAVLVESSVFNTPVTPSNAEPGEACKDSNNPFKTPTRSTIPRTPIKQSAQMGITFIPETPQKAIVNNSKTRPRMQAKRLVDVGGDTPKSRLQDTTSIICQCFAKPQICEICKRKQDMNAPRAGTPGFRAPEVLLRSFEQSTAIDIWSAGVMFISLMSGRYPFFRNAEDMISLGEIISLLGSRKVLKAAKRLHKSITLNGANYPSQDLRQVCTSLRPVEHPLHNVPDTAFDLMSHLLDPYPLTRITADAALKHPFFTQTPTMTSSLKTE